MNDNISLQHSIEIRLNSTGYKGSDVDSILPEFITDRNTTVGLTWYPSANGPDSLTIYIAVVGFFSVFAGEFAKHLAGDMYSWSKEKLATLLRSKKYPCCAITIKLNDVEIFFGDEDLFDLPGAEEVVNRFFQELPNIIENVQPEESTLWRVSYDHENDGWTVNKLD
ncbi:hypothetical protein [Halomonas halodenitrificans]|uniref:hypothetical protein n=1 Tax=Halomonas halodenitrificans TaxID=28252 RepID=UPI0012EB61AD|nr:hypothetical protein [Halomonas halodenitrificans]